jgi:hypothetical protein
MVDFPEFGIHFHISHLHECPRERPKPNLSELQLRLYLWQKRYLKVRMAKSYRYMKVQQVWHKSYLKCPNHYSTYSNDCSFDLILLTESDFGCTYGKTVIIKSYWYVCCPPRPFQHVVLMAKVIHESTCGKECPNISWNYSNIYGTNTSIADSREKKACGFKACH